MPDFRLIFPLFPFACLWFLEKCWQERVQVPHHNIITFLPQYHTEIR